MMNAPMVYELRKPKSEDPDKLYPALFLMHGKGSNERNMFDFVGGLEENFYIFSVRGHIEMPPGFAFFTFPVVGYPDRESFDEGISLVSSFLDYASEQYPLDKDHLYLLGFSQGAVMANSLALTLGNKIKGIVSLSGYVPKFVIEEYDKKPVDQISAFISHGEKDPVLSYQWGVETQEYLSKMGSHASFYSYPVGHNVSLQNQQDFKQWLLEDIKK